MSAEIPQGLTELLEEFAIAVLREKPEDLVAFAARYFGGKLAVRQAAGKGGEETGMETDKPAVVIGERMDVGNEGAAVMAPPPSLLHSLPISLLLSCSF